MRYGLLIISVICVSCASVPKRVYVDKEMKLSPDKKERVMCWNVGKYVKSVMEHVKGYTEPVNKVDDWLGWMYVCISGVMFVSGFACFGIAMLTQMYKANYVGFLCLIGAGVSAGFAEFVNWWWTVPACGIAGFIIWLITHRNKDFSLYIWIKSLWSKHDN